MCTPVFIAAQFTIARMWKQPQHPLTEERRDYVLHIYSRILVIHKKEQNDAIGSSMDGLRGYHTK